VLRRTIHKLAWSIDTIEPGTVLHAIVTPEQGAAERPKPYRFAKPRENAGF
jgi:hypothetical protein